MAEDNKTHRSVATFIFFVKAVTGLTFLSGTFNPVVTSRRHKVSPYFSLST